jgi:hypothetical protein
MVLYTAAPAAAQPLMTRCVTCHLANRAIVPAPQHLAEWEQSAHAKRGVGCDKCHGGDPWADRPADAHREVLSSVSWKSPVNPGNLVRTCAPCHERDARAFKSSLHQTLVQADERRAPTCVTCHGVMSARVPSPSALEAQCAACHPAGSAREAYPGLMRGAVETLNRLATQATALEGDVGQLTDREQRVELMVAVGVAHTAIKEAIARVHAFDFEAVTDRTQLARQQLDAVATAVRALR